MNKLIALTTIAILISGCNAAQVHGLRVFADNYSQSRALQTGNYQLHSQLLSQQQAQQQRAIAIKRNQLLQQRNQIAQNQIFQNDMNQFQNRSNDNLNRIMHDLNHTNTNLDIWNKYNH